MIPWIESTFVFTAGLGLGLFFFGGLWLTIRRIPRSPRPRTLVWSSFLIRQTLSITLLLAICRTDWHKWALTLTGFLTMRIFLIHRQGSIAKPKTCGRNT